MQSNAPETGQPVSSSAQPDSSFGTADIYGYGLGGGVALQLAIRHPELVRRRVIVSASYTSGGLVEGQFG